MNLNLGSGQMKLKGWVNVDLGSGDVRADIRNLPFADESADAVLLCHVIEHFTYEDASNVLKEIKRVVKPKGMILIESPDIQDVVEFSENVRDMSRHLYGVIPKNGTIGDCHKSGWTGEMVADELGLPHKISRGKLHGMQWRDFRVVATK